MGCPATRAARLHAAARPAAQPVVRLKPLPAIPPAPLQATLPLSLSTEPQTQPMEAGEQAATLEDLPDALIARIVALAGRGAW